MDYELAKELKDAGFPQAGHGGFATTPPSREENFRVLVGEEPKEERAYAPTLEELIDACGDKGFHLAYRYDGIWEAGKPNKEQCELQLSQGSTSLEAVARLWLALNPLPNSKK